MSNDYTPELGEVREAYVVSHVSDPPTALELVDSRDEFDRFIAKVKADAWEEGLDAGRDRWMDSREFGDPPVNPYRQEDDR